MERLASCRKFGGYSHEHASQFIAEFESYATLHYIKLYEDSRKIAAFYLHLSGPALTWFNMLSSENKSSWRGFEKIFRKQFISVDWQSPSMLVESEVFENLKLS